MDVAQRESSVSSLALFGSSFGGVTAILCGDDPRVRCALVMGTPSDFEFFADIFPHSDPARDSFLELDGMRVKSGIVVDVKKLRYPGRGVAPVAGVRDPRGKG